MKRNTICRGTVFVFFFLIIALATCVVRANKSTPSIDQAIANHWVLQGPVSISSIENVLRSFSPRVRRIILNETKAYSKDMSLLKTSMYPQSYVFSSNRVTFFVLAGARPSNSRLHLSVKPYITRYVPRLRREVKNMKPVYQASMTIGPAVSAPITLPALDSGTYRISMVLHNPSGKVVAERKMFFAIKYKNPFVPAVSYNPKIPTNRPAFTQYYQMKSPGSKYDLSSVGFSVNPKIAFPKIKQIGYDGIRIVVHWDDIEPVPGAFNFKELDRLVNIAGRNKLIVELFLMCSTHRTPYPFWNKRMVDQNSNYPGKTAQSGSARFKLVSPMGNIAFQKGYIRALKKLIKRYNNVTYVHAFRISPGMIEWAYPDTVKNKQVFDYSKTAQKGFRHYLTSVRGWSLARVNARYDKHFKSWKDVTLPQPRFSQIDTRLWWWDFVAYKKWALRNNARKLISAARKLTNKELFYYNAGGAGPFNNLFPIFKKYHVHGSIASGQVFYIPMVLDLYRKASLSTYVEPAGYENNSRPRMMFNLLTGRRALHEIGGIPNFPNIKTTVPLKKAYDKSVKRLFSWFYHKPPKHPHDISIFYSYTSAINSSKSFSLNTWNWFKMFAPLVKAAWYSVRSVNYVTDARTTPIKQNGLLIGTRALILKPGTVRQLLKFASRGNTLVTYINTGRNLVGQKHPAWAMLRALGLSPKDNLDTSNLKRNILSHWTNGKIIKMRRVLPLTNLPGMWHNLALSNGRIVAAQRPWGKGKVILMAGLPGKNWRNLGKWINTLTQVAGCRKRYVVPMTHHKVQGMTLQHKGKMYLLLTSNENKPVKMSYRVTPKPKTDPSKSFDIHATIKPHQIVTIPLGPSGEFK